MPEEKKYVSDDAQLLSEWDFEKNGDLLPETVSSGSHKKVWWKCEKGHSFQQTVNKRMLRNFNCPLCSGHKTVAGINDFASAYPDLAKEWHPHKNGDLLPSMITRKNGKKVWWQCRYGHEWQATPHDRADGTGCPFCSARRSTSFPEQAIFYYLKKLYPDAVNRYRDIFDNGMELDIFIPSIRYAVEFDGGRWHNTEEHHQRERLKYEICKKNRIMLIRVKEDAKKDWHDVADAIYMLPKRDQEQLAAVIQAILNATDPSSNMWTRKNPLCFQSRFDVDLERDRNEIREYLTSIKDSLTELRPDLVLEWNWEKNGNLSPDMFGINSNDKVWWKCNTCGHEWQTTVIQRGGKRNSGCPECSKIKRGKTFTKAKVLERGSLAENNPELAKEWHPTKNGNLTARDITASSFAKIWWLCPKCGYEWQAAPLNRNKGIGCPCCSGRVPKVGENDFKTRFPDLAKEWHPTKNGEMKPEQFLPKSGKKVWWCCSVCGNEWETVIRNRTNGHGCPVCARKKRSKRTP